MESGSVPVETRINAILDYEVKKLSKKAIARKFGMKQSCSARGVCWDNAAMESANGVIKTECLYNKFGKSKFKNRQIPIDEVVAEIAPFIEYYNNERPKQSLGGLSPVQFREQNPKGTYLMVIKN